MTSGAFTDLVAGELAWMILYKEITRQ